MKLPTKGQRVRITEVIEDLDVPPEVGEEGVVLDVTRGSTGEDVIVVDWDDSTLDLLLLAGDPYEVIERGP